MKHILMAAALLAAAHPTLPASAQATADSIATTTAPDSTAADSADYWKQLDLGEVSVTAARKLVKDDIDKMTYDMAADGEAKTKTTLEMLRKVPLVTVDGQENIRVKGSQDFKIYRNGHPDPSLEGENASKVLKSMPASSIKKIEVITEPGAKYDAEGTSAIINIVMKDNASLSGLSATLSVRANDAGSWQSGANVTTQLGRLTLSADYDFVQARGRTTEERSQSLTAYTGSGESQTNDQTQRGPIRLHFGNLSASYEMDSLNLLSLSGGGYYVLPDVDGTARSVRSGADGSRVYSLAVAFATPEYNQYELHGRADFQHKTRRDGEVLTLSYMGRASRQNQNIDQAFGELVDVPFGYTAIAQRQHERSEEQTVQADYVRPLGKGHKAEVGAKYIHRSNKSHTVMDYAGDEALDSDSRFSHTTQVAAAYAEWMAAVGPWSLRAGLRYEYSHMRASYPDHSAEGFGKSLGDWCPSASVQFKIDDANSLRANYATTINRPGIDYLNPARVEDPTSIETGAPGLGSSRNQRLALTYTHVSPKLTLSINPVYAFSNNQIGDLRRVVDGKRWHSYGNENRVRRFATWVYVQASPWATGTLSANVGAGYRWMRNPSLGMELGRWCGEVSAHFQQKLPWRLVLGLGGGCSLGHEVSSVYGVGGNWSYHYANLQRSFLKDDRLTVELWAQNPFERHSVYRSRTLQGDYTGWQRTVRCNRQFGVVVSWRIGSLKTRVKTADRTIENDDVVGGIKQKGAK